MPHWTAERRAAFDALADEFLANYGKGRTLLAVDGIDGAGKRPFADALAERLGRGGHAVFRASVDRFHRPRAERYARGVDSAEGYYYDSFDYELFRRVLIEPFRLGGSAGFVTAAFDVERDVPIEMQWQTGPQDATLVVDGAFLNRPELRGLWNYSIWLEADADAAWARLLELDGPAGQSPRYPGGQKLYLAEANPRARATAIVDNSDPELPVRVFADSC
ncbi:uridine kinase [Antiquaquibacter soli]|uniref:Uridine kinase n=1 Tax=Antiquaquibacter soli TaxID=3064523 RepID=A0ABT9BKR4_9MICO|nr:uridine kinase [Protaetiibacter sp. WY-16]MDO7881600.1 uridine kinase [Protaetiibacter sp. WY-16]